MKVFIFVFLLMFSLMSVVHAAPYFRGSGTWIPNQEIDVMNIDFNLRDSFGATAELGIYSSKEILSFGIQGTFDRLKLQDSIFRVQNSKADIWSVMGNVCTNIKNKTALTPYACASTGIVWLNPNDRLTSAKAVSEFGYGLEAGLRYKLDKVSLYGGLNWRDTFEDFRVGRVRDIDIGRYGFVAGLEF